MTEGPFASSERPFCLNARLLSLASRRLDHFCEPLGVGFTLGDGTGVVDVEGPAVEVSGGGTASTFEPLPAGAAPVDGLGLRVPGSPGVEPGRASTFDPDPAGGAPAAAAGGLVDSLVWAKPGPGDMRAPAKAAA